eukprot:m.1652678 g.1652678  ORF g.1652678 m.1652678 type:complete len:69 (+) comp94054_c0_seq1:123-329(+)
MQHCSLWQYLAANTCLVVDDACLSHMVTRYGEGLLICIHKGCFQWTSTVELCLVWSQYGVGLFVANRS